MYYNMFDMLGNELKSILITYEREIESKNLQVCNE